MSFACRHTAGTYMYVRLNLDFLLEHIGHFVHCYILHCNTKSSFFGLLEHGSNPSSCHFVKFTM